MAIQAGFQEMGVFQNSVTRVPNLEGAIPFGTVPTVIASRPDGLLEGEILPRERLPEGPFGGIRHALVPSSRFSCSIHAANPIGRADGWGTRCTPRMWPNAASGASRCGECGSRARADEEQQRGPDGSDHDDRGDDPRVAASNVAGGMGKAGGRMKDLQGSPLSATALPC